MHDWFRNGSCRWIDVGLLILVTSVSMGVMQLRGTVDRRVEMKRGEVRYDRHISTAEAQRFAQTLTDLGVFDGQPRALRLSRDSHGMVVTMVVEPQRLLIPGVAERMQREMREICASVFPGRPIRVQFVDRYLKPLESPIPQTGALHPKIHWADRVASVE